MAAPLTVEASFRRRWWPCRVAEAGGVPVAVCAAGDVAAAVPLRVRWVRSRSPFAIPREGMVRAEELAERLKERYATVTVKERRNKAVKGEAR